jgi:hypothetical protein
MATAGAMNLTGSVGTGGRVAGGGATVTVIS